MTPPNARSRRELSEVSFFLFLSLFFFFQREWPLRCLTRAASSLGSPPTNTFFKITLPLILPGIISGALFAFVTSFDEIVVILFVAGGERSLTTIPLQMWTGLREQLSPTIMAVATCLIVMSTFLLIVTELLRRRTERIRGITPR